MEISVLNAIIMATASVITGFLGILAGLIGKQDRPNREILKEQLNSVYSPLDKILLNQSYGADTVHKIEKIIFENYELVPPILLEAFLSAKQNEGKEISMKKLSRIVASCYESSRRRLGYPYSKKRIVEELTPYYENRKLWRRAVFYIYFIAWATSASLSVLILSGTVVVGSNAGEILLSLFVIGLFAFPSFYFRYKIAR